MKAMFLIGATAILLAGCNQSGGDAKTTEFDWSSRSIQIEKEGSPDNWIPIDAIKLSEQRTIDRTAVDGLKVSVNFVVGANQEILRRIAASCHDSINEMTLDENGVKQSVSQVVSCGEKSWRISLVATTDAKLPRVAAPEGGIGDAHCPREVEQSTTGAQSPNQNQADGNIYVAGQASGVGGHIEVPAGCPKPAIVQKTTGDQSPNQFSVNGDNIYIAR